MKSFKTYMDRLGPKATEKQDSQEIARQKKHLTNKAKEYHDQSDRENGGGAAEAKAKSFENARDNIKEDVGGGVPANVAGAGVAGTGDSRLPSSQKEPGVRKRKTLGLFRRK